MKILAISKATQPIKENNAQKQVSFQAKNCGPLKGAVSQRDVFVSSKAKAAK